MNGEQGTDTLKKEGRELVLNIDYSLCQGCGGCSDRYPQYFEFRDDRAWIIHADKLRPEDHSGILHVCPYYAISIE